MVEWLLNSDVIAALTSSAAAGRMLLVGSAATALASSSLVPMLPRSSAAVASSPGITRTGSPFTALGGSPRSRRDRCRRCHRHRRGLEQPFADHSRQRLPRLLHFG